MLEDPSRGATGYATVREVTHSDGGAHRFENAPPSGTLLAAMIAGAVGSRPAKRPALVIGDLNGDPWRAAALGDAVARLCAQNLTFDTDTWFPATSFGDTGAAATAVALCLSVHAFERRYAPGPSILVWSNSDDGTAASCFLEADR
jgi:3-oxoacyl-[acyl-carrier-protein] synthase-1